jgi:hypothetical protein
MDHIASRGRSSQFRSPESITGFEFDEEVEEDGGNDSIDELGLEDCGGSDEQSSRSQN